MPDYLLTHGIQSGARELARSARRLVASEKPPPRALSGDGLGRLFVDAREVREERGCPVILFELVADSPAALGPSAADRMLGRA